VFDGLPALLTVPAALDLLHVSRRTLSRLGLLSKRKARRQDRQAQAEMYAALAAVGGRA
jgi:hypothetical protein